MSSEIPTPEECTRAAAEGATKATLEFTADKVKSFVQRFRNRELAFIGKLEDIELVKEQRNSAEWKRYTKLVKNKEFRILIQMGITLRKLENNKDRLISLRNSIVRKYGPRGLHIAQFIQNRIIGKYMDSVLSSAMSEEELGKMLEEFLGNLERLCVYIKAEDDAEYKVKEISTRIFSMVPEVFIIYGAGEARETLDLVQKRLLTLLLDYTSEEYSDKERKIVFFNRNPPT
ncbi:MAG: hypothetical protein V1776_01075 [Candidatus Diapherotrites archaeon]